MECSVSIDEHNISSFRLIVLTVLYGIVMCVHIVCTGATTVTVRSTSGGGFDFWVRGQNDHRREGELSI